MINRRGVQAPRDPPQTSPPPPPSRTAHLLGDAPRSGSADAAWFAIPPEEDVWPVRGSFQHELVADVDGVLHGPRPCWGDSACGHVAQHA